MALLLLTLAAAGVFLGTLAFASRKPGYTHTRHTLSELGEWGSPLARPVALVLFLPAGLACLASAWHLERGAAASLALLLGLDYVGSALFPCDPGAPADGTFRHRIHLSLGLMQYAGAIIVILAAAFTLPSQQESWGLPLLAAGALLCLLAVALGLQTFAPIRGLLQRLAEGLLFLSAVLLAWMGQ